MHRIDDDEPVSSGSKMSGEYSLDDRKIANEKGKMGKKSPSKEPPSKASGKTVACKVYLLDGEGVDIHIDKNDIGKSLFDKVCSHLDLIEQDYFGLTYTDDRGPGHVKVWLNLDKKVSKQMKRGAWVFEFALKFYPPDPCQLREYLTRWLVSLQIRRDLLSGKIPCTFTTYAILGSYSVQADIHDFDLATHGNHFDYIRDMTFAPNQTPELLEKIAELHRLHKGQEPYEADKNFLDNAKKLAMYGVDLHKAKDSDNIGVMVGVCCSGLLILRDKLRLNRFVWPKILKLSYKRNHFYIKIRPGEMERSETTIMFKLDNHKLAKRLWKTCVEHHAFFRLRESEKPDNNLTFPRFGSKFRYSGRTLYENRNAPLVNRAPHNFDRPSPSKSGMKTTSGYSHSMDNVIHGSYEDVLHDPDGTNSEYAYGYKDGKDWKSQKGGPNTIAYAGTDADSWSALDEGGYKKRPSDSKFGGSKTSLPSQGESTLEREKAQGRENYMGLTAGSIEEQEDPDSARERRRREKENDRKRREEAEERRKREQERKKKGLTASEDKIDQLGLGDATQSAYSGGPGSAFIQSGPMGLAMGKVDITGVVGEEKTVDNKVQFLPISNPVKGNKDSIKPFSDSTLPYFNPLSTSTVGRSKVPPPVPPKGSHALDDSFRSPRVDTENIQNNSSFPGISASSKNVPLVKTETRSVTYERDNSPYDLDDGELVSAHSHSSRLQTIETTTYKTEKNGMVETRVEQKFTVSLEGQDNFDYDSALADAIRSVIHFNPDMSVERIECVQHIEDDRNGK